MAGIHAKAGGRRRMFTRMAYDVVDAAVVTMTAALYDYQCPRTDQADIWSAG